MNSKHEHQKLFWMNFMSYLPLKPSLFKPLNLMSASQKLPYPKLRLGKGFRFEDDKVYVDKAFADCKNLRDIQGLNTNAIDGKLLQDAHVFDNCPAGKNFIHN